MFRTHLHKYRWRKTGAGLIFLLGISMGFSYAAPQDPSENASDSGPSNCPRLNKRPSMPGRGSYLLNQDADLPDRNPEASKPHPGNPTVDRPCARIQANKAPEQDLRDHEPSVADPSQVQPRVMDSQDLDLDVPAPVGKNCGKQQFTYPLSSADNAPRVKTCCCQDRRDSTMDFDAPAPDSENPMPPPGLL